jgi:hypothetical protein
MHSDRGVLATLRKWCVEALVDSFNPGTAALADGCTPMDARARSRVLESSHAKVLLPIMEAAKKASRCGRVPKLRRLTGKSLIRWFHTRYCEAPDNI